MYVCFGEKLPFTLLGTGEIVVESMPIVRDQVRRFLLTGRRTTVKSTRLCALANVGTLCLAALFAAQSTQAQPFNVLHSFGKGTDGQTPFAGVIRDAEGNLYGTTLYGGTGTYGTVFKLNTAGKETVLYNFCSKTNCTDGADPEGGLVQDSEGNLYGTTSFGGTHGEGIVFKLSKTGKETVLYNFKGGTDGRHPLANLIRDSEGNLYGTTIFGGDSADDGTVFKLSNTGKETVLHRFAAGTDGSRPEGGLIEDAQGNLYGTTSGGGTSGDGVVFKVNKTVKETVLYSFTGGADGAGPYGSLIEDAKGNLSGTASGGGNSNGAGTVFKLSKTGKLTVLYTFCSQSGCTDGFAPFGGVIEDAKENLYGTTSGGGTDNNGTVFEISEAGKETVLHSFAGGTRGSGPDEGVIEDAKGNLYGTAPNGGDLSCGQGQGCGVVFKLTP